MMVAQISKRLFGRRPLLLHLSGFPCQAIGVWIGRILPPQITPLIFYTIVTSLFFFVKNPLISQQSVPLFFINFHKSNYRIFVRLIISRCGQPQYCLKSFLFSNYFFKNQCSIWLCCFYNIIRISYNFSKPSWKPFILIWISVFNMLNLIIWLHLSQCLPLYTCIFPDQFYLLYALQYSFYLLIHQF